MTDIVGHPGPRPPGPGPWLTKQQAADRLQVSLDTIERMIAGGELRTRRWGRRVVRVHRDDVDGVPR